MRRPFIVHFFYCLLVTDVHALDVRRTVLPNGLTLLHMERNNRPIVMIAMLVKACPLDESPEKAGLANFTAVLLPEGTKKRKATDVSEIFFALSQGVLDQFLSLFTSSSRKTDSEHIR
jgi:zinc protease